MYPSFTDMVRSVVPLSEDKKSKLSAVERFVGAENTKQITYLYRTKKLDIIYSRYGVTTKIIEDEVYPELKCNSNEKEIMAFSQDINAEIQARVKKRIFKRFSKDASQKILQYISPNIFGLDYVKKAAMLQLFASDPVHILLLGDPGTGKTDILRSISKLHSISSFGLGSGTSGAGLGVMVKGNEIIPGILPKADGGICCIDELNLMKREDYAYLYSAMEKGFITYNKGSNDLTFNTRIRVMATANPKKDKFVGRIADTLRQQLPFKQALLSRFHLVFMIRKPDMAGFVHIAKKIVDGDKKKISDVDLRFIKDYVNYAESLDCEFPKSYKEKVVDFIQEMKKNEKNFIVELSPRAVIGFVRLCKAHARMNLRKTVNDEDLSVIKDLLLHTFLIKNQKD